MITDPRPYYKPFEYNLADVFSEQQIDGQWLPRNIQMAQDLVNWNSDLTESEKLLIGNILKGFTQMEVLVGDYWRQVANWFPKPEICKMATTMSFFEGIHQTAYDLLNSTLGLNNYEAFVQEESIKDKIDALVDVKSDTPVEILTSLAVFSAFTEGVSIFSSFAILLSFQTRNLMKGVGHIVNYSIRDESLHSKAGIWLYHQYRSELINHHLVSNDDLQQVNTGIQNAAKLIYDLESAYINDCFSTGNIICYDTLNNINFVLTPDHIRAFIKHRIAMKLQELTQSAEAWELNENEHILLKQMSWFDNLSYGKEFGDFFAAKPTAYSIYNVDRSISIFDADDESAN